MVNNNDFNNFLESLGAFESGIDPTQQYGPNDLNWLMVFDPSKGNVDPSTVDLTNSDDLSMLQYHVHNTLGFLGKYQFGEPLLIDLGYYSPAPTGYYGSTATNEWQGTFTGKNGVFSKEDFMSEVQELAIREAFAMNMGVIETRLAQAGKTIDDYLGQEFTFTFRGEEKVGVISISGILASAHLQGPGGVANLLLNGAVSHDEYGTNILSYMGEFGGYDTPFGTAGNDNLTGSDYTETFDGGAGYNIYETGDGYDKILISENANGVDLITDFNLAKDVISLADLGGLNFLDLDIVNNNDGNAQINLANNQKVILEGVDASQLSAENFVQGPVKLAWNYNSGDTVIENFNLKHDLIDFNYAFGLNNISLYEEGGSTVIEIVDANQRYILDGIQYAELNAFNFIKAPVGFAEAFFGDTLPQPPVDDGNDEQPPVDDGSNDQPPVDNNNDNGQVVDGQDGVYAFTWNWGANEIVQDFDVSTDVINLESFWAGYGAIDLYDNNSGDAVIDLTNLNNQTITLQGISVAELTEQNFQGLTGNLADALSGDNGQQDDPVVDDPVDDPVIDDPVVDDPVDTGGNEQQDGSVYSFTWQWGDNAVIQDFDLNSGVIDLQSFWSSYDSFEIYNNVDGNAVIDLTNLNNQTITLAGVSAEELSADNFNGVTGNYADALNLTDPVDNGSDEPSPADPAAQDVFSFTWAWGSREVIENFEVENDTVDLSSFWITPDRVSVYNNAEGDAVIDLTEVNNQTITLAGVSSDELHDNSIMF